MSENATVVVETSTPEGSVGLWRDTWQEKSFLSERSHNCAVFPPLEEMLAGLPAHSIERILVGTGPGSYSGTRVGIAVAQGLAIAHGSAVVGVPSIIATPSARKKSRCRAIGDARRGDWWWCDIIDGVCCDPPQMGSMEQLAEILTDGVFTFSLEPIAENAFVCEILQETPSAGRLWQAWQALTAEQQHHFSAQVVQPVYLKPPHITAAKPGHPLQRGR
jgi:tRNA threonylcarbamoyladenosine biosynthesis protein TsaB